ncbi:MAG: hypothetical protein QM689_07900 [Oscillospiraceae bacterium]
MLKRKCVRILIKIVSVIFIIALVLFVKMQINIYQRENRNEELMAAFENSKNTLIIEKHRGLWGADYKYCVLKSGHSDSSTICFYVINMFSNGYLRQWTLGHEKPYTDQTILDYAE